MVTEILRKKEVAVLFIVSRAELERRQLHSSPTRNSLRRTFLLRGNKLHLELSKLQIRAQSEE